MMKSFSCFKPRDPFRNWSKELDKRVAMWAKNFDSSFKLLLLGPAGAGKTTILKQMKIIHFEGFSLEERQQKAKEIRSNLLESVRELTACITASGHEIEWADPENQARLDFINGLNLDDQTYDLYAAKIYDYSKRILTDKGVERLFAQLSQLSITHRSQYLLNRVDEIRNVNYIPNNDDILQSRRRTSDIQKLEFQVKVPLKSGTTIQQTFCMFDVGGQRGERRKWIQVFDGVSAVMFLIDSSSFDAADEESGRNKLRETLNLFYEVWTTRFLLNSNFVLLFNKQDILKQKIERGHRIEDHFPEYRMYRCPLLDRSSLHNHRSASEKLNLFRSAGSGSRAGTLRNDKRKGSFVGRLTYSLPDRSLERTKGKDNNNNNNNNPAERPSSQTAPNSPSPSSASTGFSIPTILTTATSTNPSNLNHPYNHGHNYRHHHHHQYQFSASAASTPMPTRSRNATSIPRNASSASLGQCSTSASHQNDDSGTDSPANDPLKIHQEYIRARSFIRDKFLQITRQVDSEQRKFSTPNLMCHSKGGGFVSADQPKRNVCYHYTTATDTDNIRDLFENLQKMVIKTTLKNMR